MTQVVLDAVLRSKLNDLKEPLELVDEQGAVLAKIYPAPPVDPPGWVRVEPPPLSEEDLARLEQEPSYTTAEVLAYLESL